MIPALFISCVTDEFGGYRDNIRREHNSHDFKVVTQEDFWAHPGDTISKLHDGLVGCDGVVHLIGRGCGYIANDGDVTAFVNRDDVRNLPLFRRVIEPFADVSRERLSYTQWEFLLAHLQRKPIWVFNSGDSIRDGHRGDKPFEPRADDPERIAAHLARVRQLGPRHSGAFSDYGTLAGLIARTVVQVRLRVSRRVNSGTRRASIRVQPPGALFPANLFMKWALRRAGGIVVFSADREIPDALPSLRDLERMLLGLTGARQPTRIWGQFSTPLLVDHRIEAHLESWAEHDVFNPMMLDELDTGKVLLGCVVDQSQASVPEQASRLVEWVCSLNAARPAWDPLVFVFSKTPNAFAPFRQHGAATVEFGGAIQPETPSTPDIVPTRPSAHPWAPAEPHGIYRLCRLVGKESIPDEKVLLKPLFEWMQSQNVPANLSEEKNPFAAGHAVVELEALDITTAKRLVEILCRWLERFHPMHAPAFVEAIGSSERESLCLAPLGALSENSPLLDSWLAGLPPDRVGSILSEAARVFPHLALSISTAWARHILRSPTEKSEMFCAWARAVLPHDLAQIASTVTHRDSSALVEQLAQAPSIDVFLWLANVAAEMDFPLDEAPAVARARPEFWRVIEALPITSAHLSRLLKLPPEDLAVLGICTNDQLKTIESQPALAQRYRRLRGET